MLLHGLQFATFSMPKLPSVHISMVAIFQLQDFQHAYILTTTVLGIVGIHEGRGEGSLLYRTMLFICLTHTQTTVQYTHTVET
jgi:hypothetical protein